MSYQGKAYANREKADAARTGKRKWTPYKKATTVARGSAYKPILNPSNQQKAIFADIATNPDHLMVSALAGCAKTSSIVEGMNKYVPAHKSMLYVIFANRNAREAESKCSENVDVKTCHSFGLAAIKKAFGKIEVDAHGEKSRAIAQALLGPEDEKIELRYNFCKAMSLAKGYLCETEEEVLDACDKHQIEYADEPEFCSNVLKALALSTQQYKRVDFDDMIYLAVKMNLTIAEYDFVFGDEVQDLSPARAELVLRAVGGKFVGVGDSHQAIFAFTGADEQAMEKLRERTNAHTLPLFTTYRCGKAIVELAKQFVPEYEAAESNADGLVAEYTEEQMMRSPEEGGVASGDFIISRTNAPLVGHCLALIRQGRKATVLGKDLGKNLAYMLKRSGAASVSGFLEWLEVWKSTECERLAARNKACDHIVDKYETMQILCETRFSIDEVRKHIEDMFSDEEDGSRVSLQTAHKSKGREANRVFVLENTYKWKGGQEDNIKYVSYTRSINELYLVR